MRKSIHLSTVSNIINTQEALIQKFLKQSSYTLKAAVRILKKVMIEHKAFHFKIIGINNHN